MKRLAAVRIKIEFPASGENHSICLYRTVKNRVFEWSYQGELRGETTPTKLLRRIMSWIGSQDFTRMALVR